MRKDQNHLVAQLDNLCIDQWLFMMIIGTEGALGLPTAYDNQGWDGEAIFFTGRGGAGRGKAKILRGREPPLPHSAGQGGEGVKICGAGRGRGGEHTACIG